MFVSDALQKVCTECRSLLQRLRREERGAVAIMTALAMIILVGFIGLGVEVGLWYAERRAMQTAADSAAMGGAFVVFENQDDKTKDTLNPAITTAALTDSKSNGFDDAADDITVTINHPPTAGTSMNSSSVEAIIVKKRPTLFASFFLGEDVDVTARSVASLKITRAPCILALAEHEERALFFSGTADVNLNKCGINVNSDDPDGAMTAQGASVVGAIYADIVGGLEQSNNAELDIADINQGAEPKQDPYRYLNIPDYEGDDGSGCTYNSIHVGPKKVETLSPGTYCGGIKIQGTATFQPGDYIIRGTLDISGTATLGEGNYYIEGFDTDGIPGADTDGISVGSGAHATFEGGKYVVAGGVLVQGTAAFGAGQYILYGGTLDIRAGAVVTTDTVDGVTFFLTGKDDDYAQVNINGGATVSIHATTAGDYLGLAFFQDRNAPVINEGSPNTFNGSSNLNVTGALYFPKQLVQFNGGSTANGTCTRIVAYMISFTGESGLTLGCGYNFGETKVYPPVVVE